MFIQEASALTCARLRASFAGFGREFIEAHEPDAKRAQNVPAKMIGRILSGTEAADRLDRLA